jgi:hypothetical protein
MRFSRRFMLLGAAVTLGVPARLWAASAPGTRAALRLRALARPAASARAVGLAYLAQVPGEARPVLLTRLVLEALALGEAEAASLGEKALRARIKARIAADFAEGRTVSVEGWLLSRSEVRFYALQAWPPGAFARV